ncbi:DNA-binding protein [Alcaligenes sp. SDU_A2]|uniref:DNA-binding protein n=1 Tax=Alcaligenes sp. SDU_A2 TaxID=3136634 RepID=UPI00312044D6
MEQNLDSHAQLQLDVAELRDRFSHTQTLYREVAALLFFRYGTTPTANKLYQLVRKGSMSAPADALQAFWQELREKSRVRLDLADIPDSLQAQTGELLGTLWRQALEQGRLELQAYQAQADQRVQQAQQQALDAEQRSQTELEMRRTVEQTVARQQEQIQTLREEIATQGQALRHATAREQVLEQEKSELQQALRRQGDQFTQDLGKLQKAIELTEERAQANERRALLEIDKERSAQTRLRQQLEQAGQELQEQRRQAEAAQSVLQEQVHAVRQELGQAQGEQRAMQAALDFSHGLSREMQTELQLLRTRTALLEREKEDLHDHIVALRNKLEQIQAERPRSVRLRRKPIGGSKEFE